MSTEIEASSRRLRYEIENVIAWADRNAAKALLRHNEYGSYPADEVATAFSSLSAGLRKALGK